MSAREVMREALCLSFYGTDWTNTSDFRRRICDNMARDGLAALSVAGLAVLPVEQADTRAADLARTRALLKGSGEMGGTRHAAAQEGDK